MTATYNEIDSYAADWISNLASAGHVAPGRVDTRSITELTAEDVRHVAQAHFFAGIAVWSAAARAAGWPDDAPLWSGSCPCQPFSQAGRGGGVTDERHLWPEWFRLIRECRPPVVVGEQVASPAGLGWLDAVLADLEGAGYTCAAADLCAAGVGAPHARQRLYFVAVSDGERLEGLRVQLRERGSRSAVSQVGGSGEARELGDAGESRGRWDDRAIPGAQGTGEGERIESRDLADELEFTNAAGGVVDAARFGREGAASSHDEERNRRISDGSAAGSSIVADGVRALANADEPHPLHGNKPRSWRLVQPAPHATSGFWSHADWIPCADGKARPVEPGTFPLAHGATARVGRLRAYGNAIVRPQAQAFLEVVIDMLTATDEPTTNLTKASIL